MATNDEPDGARTDGARTDGARTDGARTDGGMCLVGVRADEVMARSARARAIGLFRYQLIREPADPAHSTRARGRMVREIAARTHVDPFGRPIRVSRESLDRWIRAWRAAGFDALVPSPRQTGRRLPAEVIDLAVVVKRENPQRTAAQVRRILRAQLGWAPGERTLQRHFADLTATDPHAFGGANGDAAGSGVFGRFEAARPNELWTGDALHGPRIAGRKSYLLLTWNQTAGWIITNRHRHHVVRGPVARERRGEVARPGTVRTSRRVARHLDQLGPGAADDRRVCAGTGGVSAGL
jgi:putative transposase